ncbi:hypothetical protein EAH80_18915 [Mycobacterium hodleri]|uniref:Uncharacterized protein n=1 Tax=Mycolicibacterium hodleri TaxID=49897 RepID=A0A502E5C4_9MYCO|nr:hypothetical protein EAH80_18915 [Mycolicibacterium hodleri]
MLQLAKYPLCQQLSFLTGPLPNLGHDEKLSEWTEHSVDVCLAPRAPLRRGRQIVASTSSPAGATVSFWEHCAEGA